MGLIVASAARRQPCDMGLIRQLCDMRLVVTSAVRHEANCDVGLVVT